MGLLRRRDFQLIFVAFALSSLGDYVALITLTLRVEAMTDSGWAVAGLLLTGLVPPVLFAPISGLLVDRMESVRLLAVTAVFQAGVAAALAFTPGLVPTLALSFLLGTGLSVTQPALFALLPRAVGEDHTTQANAYLEVARWGGATAGPLLAAVMTETLGANSTLLVNAGTFLVIAALGPLLTVRRPPVAEVGTGEGGRPRGEARAGMAFIARDQLLRLMVLVLGFVVVFAAADNVAEVFFAKDVLGAGNTGYGILITTWTLGMVVGSTLTGRFATPPRLAPILLGGAVVGGSAVVVAAGAAVFPVAVGGFLVGGIANGTELVAIRSLLHHRVPDRLRGRAFAAYYGLIQAAQIVALGASGGLVEVFGSRTTMLIAGTGAAAVGVIGTILYLTIPRSQRATEQRDAGSWTSA